MKLPRHGMTSSSGGRQCRQDLGSCLRCQDTCLQHGASGPHQLQLHLRIHITTCMLLVASSTDLLSRPQA